MHALDVLNERLMVAIRHDGRAFPSNAELGGRYCLRACLVNHRTEADDVDALLDATLDARRGARRQGPRPAVAPRGRASVAAGDAAASGMRTAAVGMRPCACRAP